MPRREESIFGVRHPNFDSNETDMRTDASLLRNLRQLTPLFLRPALGVTFLSAAKREIYRR